MKVKFYIFTILFIFLYNINLKANEILFDSCNLKIQNNGNTIYGKEVIAKIPSKKIEIEGDKSIYDKINSKLTLIDNVKVYDRNKNVYIESNNLIYDQIENTIYSHGKTLIKVDDIYEINSKDMLYDRNSMRLSSKQDTIIEDNKLNIYNFEQGFLFDTIKEIISSKKTNITDSSNNNYSFENTKINLKTNEIVGKELKIDFIDSFFGNEKNDPKLSGKSAVSNDDTTKVFKTVL